MKVFSLYKLRFFIYSTFRVTVYRNIYLQVSLYKCICKDIDHFRYRSKLNTHFMNISPYRAKLPDLPLPEKRHGGAFQTVPWETYPHPRER